MENLMLSEMGIQQGLRVLAGGEKASLASGHSAGEKMSSASYKNEVKREFSGVMELKAYLHI